MPLLPHTVLQLPTTPTPGTLDHTDTQKLNLNRSNPIQSSRFYLPAMDRGALLIATLARLLLAYKMFSNGYDGYVYCCTYVRMMSYIGKRGYTRIHILYLLSTHRCRAILRPGRQHRRETPPTMGMRPVTAPPSSQLPYRQNDRLAGIEHMHA